MLIYQNNILTLRDGADADLLTSQSCALWGKGALCFLLSYCRLDLTEVFRYDTVRAIEMIKC